MELSIDACEKAMRVIDAASGMLRFFFDFLDNPDLEISNDAYKEFGNADYKDFKAMAKELPSDRVIKWLKNPETPSFRMGLYASMLGHCGRSEHTAVLLSLLDDPDQRATSGVDGTPLRLRDQGTTIFFSSHILSDAETLCDRVAVLRGGRLLSVGPLGELLKLDVTHLELLVSGVTPGAPGLETARRADAVVDARAGRDAGRLRARVRDGRTRRHASHRSARTAAQELR
jgi:hypothetical protein